MRSLAVYPSNSTATVALAAAVYGVMPAQIAKTLLLRVDKRILLVITRGDARLDNRKSKAIFGGKASMLGADEVAAITGHPVGGADESAVRGRILTAAFGAFTKGGYAATSTLEIAGRNAEMDTIRGIPGLTGLRRMRTKGWTIAVVGTCALVAITFLLALAVSTATAQVAEPTAATPSVHPTWDIHETTTAGIPGLIAIPDHVVSSTPILVLYHGFGAPASPEALAKAVPPIPRAISFYPWLPLFGPRMGPGGTNDLVQRQSDDYVGRLLYPVMAEAAAELPKLVDAISASYHLSNQRPIVVFGFSAGGAAALLSLTESAARPQGVIVMNAPLSIFEAVDGYERQLGRRYSWTKAARHAAIRYDVGAHASQIAQQHSGTCFCSRITTPAIAPPQRYRFRDS
jgi:predicted esterase